MKLNQVWIICSVKKEKYVLEEGWSHVKRITSFISLHLVVQLWCKFIYDTSFFYQKSLVFFPTALTTTNVAGGRMELRLRLLASRTSSSSSIWKLSLRSRLSLFLTSWLACTTRLMYCTLADWEGGGWNKVGVDGICASSSLWTSEIQIQLYPLCLHFHNNCILNVNCFYSIIF